MKRKFRIIWLSISISLLFSISSMAASTALVDDADLFTQEQEEKLIDQIEGIRNKYDFDVTFVTTMDTDGETLELFAERHPAQDFSRNGIIFAQDTYGREYYTIGRGTGITVVSDAALARIDEVIVPDLKDGNYYDAYENYLDLTIVFLDAAESGSPYEGEPLGFSDFALALLIGIVGGLIIAFVATGAMKSNMNTAKKKREAADYVKQGSFYLGHSNDKFLYENTTSEKKQSEKSKSNNSSSGGRGGGSY